MPATARPVDMTSPKPCVTVVYALSHQNVWTGEVELTPAMTIEQAIQASGFAMQHPDVDWQASGVGIFGKRAKPGDLVQAGDRIEVYRALVFDPKESRRRRALHRQRQKQNGDLQRGRQRTV